MRKTPRNAKHRITKSEMFWGDKKRMKDKEDMNKSAPGDGDGAETAVCLVTNLILSGFHLGLAF